MLIDYCVCHSPDEKTDFVCEIMSLSYVVRFLTMFTMPCLVFNNSNVLQLRAIVKPSNVKKPDKNCGLLCDVNNNLLNPDIDDVMCQILTEAADSKTMVLTGK